MNFGEILWGNGRGMCVAAGIVLAFDCLRGRTADLEYLEKLQELNLQSVSFQESRYLYIIELTICRVTFLRGYS